MKRITFTCMALLVGVCAAFVPPAVAQHEHPAGDPSKLGKVSFPVSCEASVQPQFSSAVAMLHSFWYEKASDTFAAVAQEDPTCGMAYWGIAMTYYHPLWQAPRPADLKAGAAAAEKTKLAGAKTQRERDSAAGLQILAGFVIPAFPTALWSLSTEHFLDRDCVTLCETLAGRSFALTLCQRRI
jgi:hypothetical protein